jgi:hypothetical protein
MVVHIPHLQKLPDLILGAFGMAFAKSMITGKKH